MIVGGEGDREIHENACFGFGQLEILEQKEEGPVATG